MGVTVVRPEGMAPLPLSAQSEGRRASNDLAAKLGLKKVRSHRHRPPCPSPHIEVSMHLSGLRLHFDWSLTHSMGWRLHDECRTLRVGGSCMWPLRRPTRLAAPCLTAPLQVSWG